MGFLHWVEQNWFSFLQSAGIIGGLLFTAVTLRTDAQARRIGNLIAITQHQREIWTHIYTRPDLARVLDKSADLKAAPVTEAEELFVNFLILHLNSAYHAMQAGMFIKPEGLQRDIRIFFSLPIPKAVWNSAKLFQDEHFVRFVETNHAAG
jgi:hypothetical protein